MQFRLLIVFACLVLTACAKRQPMRAAAIAQPIASTRPTAPAGTENSVSFCGKDDVGLRICYVAEAQSSVETYFDDLRARIFDSVKKLSPEQSFNVIFFQEDTCLALHASRLVAATPENQRLAEKFLATVTLRSSTSPAAALKLAASLKPDLMYLVTDGDFEGPGNVATIEYCKANFPATRINTIAVLHRDENQLPLELEFVQVLQTIARNSGGQLRIISEEDVARRN